MAKAPDFHRRGERQGHGTSVVKDASTPSCGFVSHNPQYENYCMTIDEDMLQRIDRLVVRQRMGERNRSQLFRRAIEEYISRLEREAEEQREREIFRRHRRRLESQAMALVREQAKL